MRDFVDAILAAIDAASLSDEEFDDLITLQVQTLNKALYLEILGVLDFRETMSGTRDRLGFYFKARGVDIGEAPSAGSSKIYLGDDLCS